MWVRKGVRVHAHDRRSPPIDCRLGSVFVRAFEFLLATKPPLVAREELKSTTNIVENCVVCLVIVFVDVEVTIHVDLSAQRTRPNRLTGSGRSPDDERLSSKPQAEMRN